MIAVASLVLFSCTKEELKDDSSQSQEETPVPEGFVAKTFTAAVSELTRAAFTGTRVNWEDTDRIAVYDGTNMNEFTVRSIENGLAVFEGAVTEGSDEFYAVFPYTAASGTMPAEDGTVSVIVPSEQKVGETTSDTGAIVSVAKADDVDHFQFRNIVSMVKISVPDGVTSVKFSADNARLSGACTVKVGETAQGAQGESVTLVPDTENGMFTAGEYWISVVPASLTDGCRVEYEGNGQTASVEVPGALDLVRNTSLDITAETAEVPWVKTSISTADDLLAFAAASDTYTAEDLVVLGADIDMSEKTWTPFVLGCQFDGRGHRIYNISSDAGCIFTDISSGAVLKDVVFGSKDGTAYDGTSSISMSGTAGNAGLAGTNNGTVSGVTSFIPVTAVTASPAIANEVRVGGLVGSNYGSISGCVYGGSINVSGTSDKMIFIGGITGWNSERSVSITNTSNKGSIYVDNDHGQAAAGIAGMHRGGDVTGCTNSGKITVKNSSAKNSYFGGIAGFIQIQAASGSRIEDCANTGEFEMANTTVFGVGGIAGVIHRAATGAVTLAGCKNSADVFMSGSHTAENVNLGGIAGMCDANNSNPYTGTNVISSCTNSGKIYYRESRSLGNLDGKISTAGGIIGWTNNRIEITGCTNTGDVSSDKISLDYLGGIAGYVNNGTVITYCSNTAPVTLDLGTTVTYSGGNRPGAGGIACYTGGTVSLEGNENSGAVSITISKSDQCAAGGIVATTEGNLTLTGNTNSGPVTSTSGTQDRPAGGIVGRVMRTLTMSGNTNTGAVTAVGADGFDSDNVMAGGLIGLIDQGAANVPTVINSEKDVADCAVSSTVGRAGLLFAIMNHVASGDYQPSAVFTDCRIGGTVEGKVKDGSETSGPVTLDATNFEDYSYSYKGANAVLTVTGLSLAE